MDTFYAVTTLGSNKPLENGFKPLVPSDPETFGRKVYGGVMRNLPKINGGSFRRHRR